MSRTPEPRPALQKAPDGGVHPASAPRTSAPKHLHPAAQAPAVAPGQGSTSGRDALDVSGKRSEFKPGDLRARKASKDKKHAAPMVTLKVEVPKDLRKDARKKASRGGFQLDAVVASLLRAWVDG